MFAPQQKSEEYKSIETYPNILMDTRSTLVSAHVGNSSNVHAPKTHWMFGSQRQTDEHKSIETYADPFIDTQCTMASSHDGSSSKDNTPRKWPIKNTFIHYDEPYSCDAQDCWPSAPAVMLHGPFKLKVTPMQEAHFKGTCQPCFYFRFKPDSCRMGKDCEFCHICSREDIQKKKKDKKRIYRDCARDAQS